MTAKEMDRMDQEVMALVNERQTEGTAPEEIATSPTAPRNDEVGAEEQIPENQEITVETVGESEDPIDWDAPLQEKDGKYCISKEGFAALKAELKRSTILKNSVCVAVCTVIMGVLFLASSRPELLNYIVGAGVISCSVTIGVCLAQLVEVNR